MKDILFRVQAKVVEQEEDNPATEVVEIDKDEFQECLTEIIRLRAALEGLSEMPAHFLSVKRIQKLARESILPVGVTIN